VFTGAASKERRCIARSHVAGRLIAAAHATEPPIRPAVVLPFHNLWFTTSCCCSFHDPILLMAGVNRMRLIHDISLLLCENYSSSFPPPTLASNVEGLISVQMAVANGADACLAHLHRKCPLFIYSSL
jgi:hypothetical protein